MTGTLITTALCLIGILWIAATIAALLMLHQQLWPNQSCSCGRWQLDEDSGVVLPLVDHDLIHDRALCCPWQEHIAHPEDTA